MAIENTFGLRLDIAKAGEAQGRVTRQQVPTRVGDVGSTAIVATIVRDGEAVDLSGHSARLEVLKADGTWYRQACTVDASAGTVAVTLAAQAVASPGRSGRAYVSLYRGTSWVCSTEDFDIVVLDAVDVSGVESDDYSDQLEEAIASATSAATLANTKAGLADDAATLANQKAQAANAAATSATEAAAEARSAVASGIALYLSYETVGDTDYLTLNDATEED